MTRSPERDQPMIEWMRERLGLNYGLSFGQGAVDHPQVTTQEAYRNHVLVLPEPGWRDAREVQAETMELLIQAKLYEMVHPLFGRFEYWSGVEGEPETVEQVARAQRVKQVWVSDLTAGWVSSEVLRQRMEIWLQQSALIPEAELTQFREDHLVRLAWAGGTIRRHKMDKLWEPFQVEAIRAVGVWEGDEQERLENLVGWMARLGRLPVEVDTRPLPARVGGRDRRLALERLERAVQRTAEILGYPVKPMIAGRLGRAYWTVAE